MVANKIAKITGVLNRLKYVYPWQILLSLYNTLIMSHINYGLLLWGTKVYELEHLQKKAVRTIKNNHPLAHNEPLLKKFKTFKRSRPVPHKNTEVLLQACSYRTPFVF